MGHLTFVRRLSYDYRVNDCYGAWLCLSIDVLIKYSVMAMKQTIKRIVNDGLLQKFGLRIYSTKAFGRDIIYDIANIIGSPDVMLDVGANIGQTVEMWTDAYTNLNIHSFEPVKRLYDELVKKPWAPGYL